MLKADIVKLEGGLQSQKDKHKVIEINDVHVRYKERLSPLRDMNVQLLRYCTMLNETLLPSTKN